MMKRLSVFGVVSVLSVLGCGGSSSSSGPAAKMGTTNPMGAKSVVMSTAGLKSSLDSGDGTSVSGTVTGLGIAGAQQIVSPGAAMAATLASGATPCASGTATCDMTGCVYDKCVTGTSPNTSTLDGSVKSTKVGEGSKIDADLTISTMNAGSATGNINWHMTGSISVSATTIDGALQTDGTGMVSQGGTNISYTYFNQLKYNAITLANGQPTGGSIYAKWSINIAGVPQGSSAWEGTVMFP